MIFVFLDRDGTLNEDSGYFGRYDDWREKLRIYDTVFEGLRLLAPYQDVRTYIVSNQSGVARDFFDEERGRGVTEEVIRRIRQNGGRIDGYKLCPYIPLSYLFERVIKGKLNPREINWRYARLRVPDRKPGIGMLRKIVEENGSDLAHSVVYVVGDLLSDVQTGWNVPEGRSILVPNGMNTQVIEGVKRLLERNPSLRNRTYLASDFYDGIEWILRDLGEMDLIVNYQIIDS